MASRGGKGTQEDTRRAPPRAKSTSSKKVQVDKADASTTKVAAAKKGNGSGKSAAPEAVQASSQVAAPKKGNGANQKAAVGAKPITQPAARVDKPTRPRKVAEPIAVQSDADVPSPEQKRRMIEVAAYLRAERAGFGTTDPQQDWIEAEREVEQALAARQL